MSVIAVLASVGSALIALSVAALAVFGFDATYTAGIPALICLTGLSSLALGWFALRMDYSWRVKLVTVPWAMIFAVVTIPILLMSPFVFLAKVWIRDWPRR
ncbi:hypothetical protein OIU34_18535 [Pararhizobium sp. BT-229]|uniref:hypothetical protein n=1 Tax=Pararhizobium sp. BT-229 TaxID=2986923 RepID=UPI0021F74B79|nr:hypothetical protein [Pararhizobium sp. BT-229]MCV9963877.1 hypothetical protein [Pararhizobium sp. BT-229]